MKAEKYLKRFFELLKYFMMPALLMFQYAPVSSHLIADSWWARLKWVDVFEWRGCRCCVPRSQQQFFWSLCQISRSVSRVVSAWVRTLYVAILKAWSILDALRPRARSGAWLQIHPLWSTAFIMVRLISSSQCFSGRIPVLYGLFSFC